MPRKLDNLIVGRPWDAQQDDALKSLYAAKVDITSAMAVMGRSKMSIGNRAHRLGLTKRQFWTDEDKEALRILFGVSPLHEVASRFGRSERAVSQMAIMMGIRAADIRQGYELVNQAARRHKIAPAMMHRIIRWAKLSPHRPVFESKAKEVKWSHRFYDSADVDDAVDKWTSYDTLQSAARRTGWAAPTIARWLQDAGVKPNKLGNGRRVVQARWRVPRDVVDRIVASRQKEESIEDACRRVGVNRLTMRRWLRADNALTGPGRVKRRLDPGVIDRIVEKRRTGESVESAARRHKMCPQVLRRLLLKAGVIALQDVAAKRVLDPDTVDMVIDDNNQRVLGWQMKKQAVSETKTKRRQAREAAKAQRIERNRAEAVIRAELALSKAIRRAEAFQFRLDLCLAKAPKLRTKVELMRQVEASQRQALAEAVAAGGAQTSETVAA